MMFSREMLQRVVAVRYAKDLRFWQLVITAGLDPASDLIKSDLRRVDFGEDDFRGFDFGDADVRGAKLGRAQGLLPEMFIGIQDDEATTWPAGFRERIENFDVQVAARNLILSGEAPPRHWRPHIQALDLSPPQGSDQNDTFAAREGRVINRNFDRSDLLDGLSVRPGTNGVF